EVNFVCSSGVNAPYTLIQFLLVFPIPPTGFLFDRLLLHSRWLARNPAGSSACSGCVDTGLRWSSSNASSSGHSTRASMASVDSFQGVFVSAQCFWHFLRSLWHWRCFLPYKFWRDTVL